MVGYAPQAKRDDLAGGVARSALLDEWHEQVRSNIGSVIGGLQKNKRLFFSEAVRSAAREDPSATWSVMPPAIGRRHHGCGDAGAGWARAGRQRLDVDRNSASDDAAKDGAADDDGTTFALGSRWLIATGGIPLPRLPAVLGTRVPRPTAR